MKKKKKREEKKFQQFLQTRLSARNFTFAADHIINGEIYAFQWVERIFHPYLRTNCCRVIPRDRWNKWKYRKLAPFSLSPWRGGGGRNGCIRSNLPRSHVWRTERAAAFRSAISRNALLYGSLISVTHVALLIADRLRSYNWQLRAARMRYNVPTRFLAP